MFTREAFRFRFQVSFQSSSYILASSFQLTFTSTSTRHPALDWPHAGSSACCSRSNRCNKESIITNVLTLQWSSGVVYGSMHVRVVGLTHALRRARLHSVMAAARRGDEPDPGSIVLDIILSTRRVSAFGAHSPRETSRGTHGLPKNVVQDYKDEWENQDRKFHLLLEMNPAFPVKSASSCRIDRKAAVTRVIVHQLSTQCSRPGNARAPRHSA